QTATTMPARTAALAWIARSISDDDLSVSRVRGTVRRTSRCILAMRSGRLENLEFRGDGRVVRGLRGVGRRPVLRGRRLRLVAGRVAALADAREPGAAAARSDQPLGGHGGGDRARRTALQRHRVLGSVA